MNRIAATAALSLTLAPFTARSLVAQDRPDFSGTWELNPAESRMIGQGGHVGPPQLGERRIAWRVEHRDPEIAVTITVRDPDRPHEFAFRCTTDGRTCVNELPELREVRTMSARWSGAVLVMTQHASTPHGSFDAEDRLSLSDSGRTLVFDRIVRDERGERSVRQVFRRAGRASGRPSAQAPRWAIRGDTAGAPTGCSTAAGIGAIDQWFAAFNRADAAGLEGAMAARGFVVSTGRFTHAEPFVRIESIDTLAAYARERAAQHERVTLDSVRFYGWVHGGGHALGFMPFYVRAADDLGSKPLHGVGKASYFCGEGIHVLNLAPRPAVMGGP